MLRFVAVPFDMVCPHRLPIPAGRRGDNFLLQMISTCLLIHVEEGGGGVGTLCPPGNTVSTCPPPCTVLTLCIVQGPCCARQCSFQVGNKCREDNGCRDESYCNGRGTACPASQLKPNRTVCHDEFVCFLGVSQFFLKLVAFAYLGCYSETGVHIFMDGNFVCL
jgi:hypothetical protein